MTLTPIERQRKRFLLDKYNKTGILLPYEAEELRDLTQRDDELDEGSKLLILLGLGALLAYLLSKE